LWIFLSYAAWSERCKQILKKWRALPNEKKAPYLTQARDNRAAIRMKKTQQVIVHAYIYIYTDTIYKYAYAHTRTHTHTHILKGTKECELLTIAFAFMNESNLLILRI